MMIQYNANRAQLPSMAGVVGSRTADTLGKRIPKITALTMPLLSHAQASYTVLSTAGVMSFCMSSIHSTQ